MAGEFGLNQEGKQRVCESDVVGGGSLAQSEVGCHITTFRREGGGKVHSGRGDSRRASRRKHLPGVSEEAHKSSDGEVLDMCLFLWGKTS